MSHSREDATAYRFVRIFSLNGSLKYIADAGQASGGKDSYLQ